MLLDLLVIVFFIVFCIVLCVLQIMLFFKIWGMTNDLKVIKAKYVDCEVKANHAIHYFAIKELKGQEASKQFLLNAIIDDIETTYLSDDTESNNKLASVLQHVSHKYDLLLQDAGMASPTMEDYKNFLCERKKNPPFGIEIGKEVTYVYYAGSKVKQVGTAIEYLPNEQMLVIEERFGNLIKRPIAECRPV